jgi:GNAT superfamily N-acetyltransferase
MVARTYVSSWLACYRGIGIDRYMDGLDVAVQTRRWREIIEDPRMYDVAMLVAEVDGVIAGFVGAGHSHDDDDDPEEVGEVGDLYIDPSRLASGIGGRLLDAATQSLREAFLADATLWVIKGNSPARRFFERHGWHADGRSKRCDLSLGGTSIRYRTSLVRRRSPVS